MTERGAVVVRLGHVAIVLLGEEISERGDRHCYATRRGNLPEWRRTKLLAVVGHQIERRVSVVGLTWFFCATRCGSQCWLLEAPKLQRIVSSNWEREAN